jgi:hypothetical protein
VHPDLLATLLSQVHTVLSLLYSRIVSTRYTETLVNRHCIAGELKKWSTTNHQSSDIYLVLGNSNSMALSIEGVI